MSDAAGRSAGMTERIDVRTRNFFDQQVSALIVGKYGLHELDAIRAFLNSETYEMLLDKSLEIYTMSPLVVFSMWESERVTGDPRNSSYIRSY